MQGVLYDVGVAVLRHGLEMFSVLFSDHDQKILACGTDSGMQATCLLVLGDFHVITPVRSSQR
jgi:hypothetical protein